MAIIRTGIVEAAGGGATLNINFDSTGYHRALAVAFYYQDDDNVADILTITCDGVPMTPSVSQLIAGGPAKTVYIYYIAGNAIGTNVVALSTSAAGGTFHNARVMGYKNTLQTSVVDASHIDSDAGGLDTWNITTTRDDCWILSYLVSISTVTDYANGTNCIMLGAGSPMRAGDSNASSGVAGIKTVSATAQGSGSWFSLSVAIAPAVLIPILTTSAVSNIALRTAVGNATLDFDGDATITERGFVLSTSPTPTTANTKFIGTGTVGALSTNLTGLTPNTTYYVRSYGINANGTGYGNEVSFTTNNIASTELTKNITAVEGATYAVSLRLTGTLGTVTVKLGRNGGSAVFNATGGVQTMQGVYSGADGIIFTRSADFNGTIDDLLWVRVVGGGSINWASTTLTTVLPISSEVFFARVEDKEFNTYRLYRFLDLLFKDLNGYATVTIKRERDDGVITIDSVFSVGNTSSPASPFSKKRVSFLCKDQAIIIGLSNASLNETFAIAKFMLTGHKRTRKMFGADKIIST